jgi:valyl-tRNA synthetase
MSKSKGNSIDPLQLIEEYGADALRFTICSLTGLGRDLKLGAARVESHRRFVTKLWNAARFCEMNDIRPDGSFEPEHATLPLTRWILDAANSAIDEATTALEAYRLDEYAGVCYRLTWDTFCDWFVEFAKPALSEQEVRQTAAHVLGTILGLLHPVMPFVTEELWDRFGYGEPCSLIRAAWPQRVEVTAAPAARAELDWVVRLVSQVRSVRTEMNVPPGKMTPILLRDAAPETLARGQRWIEAIRRLARVSELKPLVDAMPKGSAQLVLDEATVVLPLAEAIDLGAERARLGRERDKAAGEARKLVQKLDNAEFVRRAPEEIVEDNRERLAAIQSDIARLDAALGRIEG